MDWRYNTIWFDQIEKENFHQQNLKINKLADNFISAEYAILWHFRPKGLSFDNLNESKKLLYLELNSSDIIDFQKIEKFENLKRLELNCCLKLENDTGIEALKNTLEFLLVDGSKKFTFTKKTFELKKLKVLRLYCCAPIKNLDFLKHFPNLIDFRFYETNILDGNLNPIIQHPTIKTVGFNNKRHYNLTDQQIKAQLKLKSDIEFKEYIYKGKYETFRYEYE